MANDGRFNMLLPQELLATVKLAAAACDLSASQWIRQAIREKLERDE